MLVKQAQDALEFDRIRDLLDLTLFDSVIISFTLISAAGMIRLSWFLSIENRGGGGHVFKFSENC